MPRNFAASSGTITRCRLPNDTYGAPLLEFCACCMSGSICHDPSGVDRSRNFPDPVRGLCAVSGRNPIRSDASSLVAGACDRETSAGLAAARRRQLHPARAFFRRAAEFDLHSGAHRKRQVRPRGGEMSGGRVLRDAPWLSSGPAARVLELLNGQAEEARVVGGAVRNALLKLPVADIDIATTALPAEVIRRAKAAGIKSVPTGIDHGTVTLVIDR